MHRLVSFLVGAATGALVGLTLGLLLAPTSGEDLRANAKSRYEQIQQQVNQAAQDRRTELEKQLEALRAPRKPESA